MSVCSGGRQVAFPFDEIKKSEVFGLTPASDLPLHPAQEEPLHFRLPCKLATRSFRNKLTYPRQYWLGIEQN